MSKVKDDNSHIIVTGKNLTIEDIAHISSKLSKVLIDKETKEKVEKNRCSFERTIESMKPVYGASTGFGEMVNIIVHHDLDNELQTNLVRSHAAGVGPYFSALEVRSMMLARLNALARGYSAVRPALLEKICEFLNLGIVPVVPEKGSIGASGDLSPLSHIACCLIGEGYVIEGEKHITTVQALEKTQVRPIVLEMKEGLALINGTSGMSGCSALVLFDALNQVKLAQIVSAFSLEVLEVSDAPFDIRGHDIAKPHHGQTVVARNLRTLLKGSRLLTNTETLQKEVVKNIRAPDEPAPRFDIHETNISLQNAYSLRCIPQVLGILHDTLTFARTVVETELNSSNDNPLYFDEGYVFHGGNFHGQYVASVMDYVAISMTNIGILADRQVNRLLNPSLNLRIPRFLINEKPGLHSGFAGVQYTVTSLVAENRTKCTPASIQSIPSNNDNQDIVSMGLIATRKARDVIDNNNYILAVQLLMAAQAVDLLKVHEKLGNAGKIVYEFVRESIPMLKKDRFMSEEIYKLANILKSHTIFDRMASSGIICE